MPIIYSFSEGLLKALVHYVDSLAGEDVGESLFLNRDDVAGGIRQDATTVRYESVSKAPIGAVVVNVSIARCAVEWDEAR